jgi:hypothetical protein
MVQTPVGARCRECANVRRIPTYNLAAGTFLRAAGGALAGGLVLGIAWWLFNPLTLFFFGVLAGLAVGFGVGEAVSFSTNRKAGLPLQVIAVGGVLLAYVVRVGLLFLTSWDFGNLQSDLGGLIALGIGCFIAAGRLR